MTDVLVNTDWLAEHLDDGSVRVLEIGATDDDDAILLRHELGVSSAERVEQR